METALIRSSSMAEQTRPGRTEKGDGKAQRRYWEVDHFFWCPIISMCLNVAEQRRIVNRLRLFPKNMSAFEIHETLVANSDNENPLSQKIDSVLKARFKKEREAFFHLEEDEFIRNWKVKLQAGKMEGMLWIAATRPDLSPMAKNAIFGDIHMQMHLNVSRNAKMRGQIAREQNKNQVLCRRLRVTSRATKHVKKENERLREELDGLRRSYDSLDKEKKKRDLELSQLQGSSVLGSLRKENLQSKYELRKLCEEMKSYQDRLKMLQNKNDKLFSQLQSQRKINGRLKEETERIITEISSLNHCDKTYPSFDLCQRRILIVGGMTRIESAYRQLIEKNGGVFEYHDGRTKGGIKELKSRVRRADVVFCPVNINSHNACSAVKKLGKKYGKPIHMLAGSGLNAISQALLEYEEGVKAPQKAGSRGSTESFPAERKRVLCGGWHAFKMGGSK